MVVEIFLVAINALKLMVTLVEEFREPPLGTKNEKHHFGPKRWIEHKQPILPLAMAKTQLPTLNCNGPKGVVTSQTPPFEIAVSNWGPEPLLYYHTLRLFSLSVQCLSASFLLQCMCFPCPPLSPSLSPLPLPLGDASAVVRLELKAANRVALC